MPLEVALCPVLGIFARLEAAERTFTAGGSPDRLTH